MIPDRQASPCERPQGAPECPTCGSWSLTEALLARRECPVCLVAMCVDCREDDGVRRCALCRAAMHAACAVDHLCGCGCGEYYCPVMPECGAAREAHHDDLREDSNPWILAKDAAVLGHGTRHCTMCGDKYVGVGKTCDACWATILEDE